MVSSQQYVLAKQALLHKVLNRAVNALWAYEEQYDEKDNWVAQIACDLERLRDDLSARLQSHSLAATADEHERWVDDIVTAYKRFGSRTSHRALYRAVEQLRKSVGRSWPRNARETIRQTLQAYNVESRQYRGGPDFFRMVRPGLWRLKDFESH